jgi:hypothetical protein
MGKCVAIVHSQLLRALQSKAQRLLSAALFARADLQSDPGEPI